MAGTITEDELLNKARELGGEIGDAVKWMRRQGLTLAPNPIPPANRELPPVEPQGGLKTAEKVSTMADDTGEEDTGAEDTGTLGGLDLASIDFGQIKSDPAKFFQSFITNMQTAEKNRAASAKRMYEEADRRILEKYAGPSQSERLFALSRAMLSPTDFPGFKGFLGNVTGALSENAKAAREAEQLREQKQFENYQQYQKGELERAAAQPTMAANLIAKYLAATKAPTSTPKSVVVENGVAYDPISGEKLVAPNQAAWDALAAAPTKQNYDNFIRQFGPRFAEKAMRITGISAGGE